MKKLKIFLLLIIFTLITNTVMAAENIAASNRFEIYKDGFFYSKKTPVKMYVLKDKRTGIKYLILDNTFTHRQGGGGGITITPLGIN